MTQHSRDTPQFYLTAPSACPYLAGKEERKVFTHLVGERAGELNNILTQGGFRRSQSIAYRPACEGCRACVSVRVVAKDFCPTRNMRRIANRNADIVGDMKIAMPTSEQYAIFRAYLDSRHRDGGMADMTVLDYAMMVEDSHIETRIIEYRRRGKDGIPSHDAGDVDHARHGGDGKLVQSLVQSKKNMPPPPPRGAPHWTGHCGPGRPGRPGPLARSPFHAALRSAGVDTAATRRRAGDLLAVALTDVLGDGLSMVYSFFEPDEGARSLGTYMVLDHIARARQMGLAYVYLGYWVRGSRKMDYKSRFLPQERLTPDGWARVE